MEQVAKLHGHASGDEEFWIEVVDETGDVDDLQVSVVWVVIVAGKGQGFGAFVMFGRRAMSRKRRTRCAVKGRWSVMRVCRRSMGS